MNTPNWMNALPGAQIGFSPNAKRNAFGTKADALRYFDPYLQTVNPNVNEHALVTGVQQQSNGKWRIMTSAGTYESFNAVICTGQAPKPIIPSIASEIEPSVLQIHSSEYARPQQINTPDVLVVGSGSSGVQVCLDLVKSREFRHVYLSVSGNKTLPWKIAGIPTHTLLRLLRVYRINQGSRLGKRIAGRAMARSKGERSTPPSPSEMHRDYGVILVDKVADVENGAIICRDGSSVRTDDLSIIWCTGFEADNQYIEVQRPSRTFSKIGEPIHDRGVAVDAPGLYFLGLRFQYSFSSHFIYGVGSDAKYVADHIVARLSSRTGAPVQVSRRGAS